MSAMSLRLARDHRRFGRVLDLLAGLLERFAAGAEPSYDLFHELIEYVIDYADRVHHPTEELLFKHLLTHTPAQAELLHALIREHEELRQLNRSFRAALVSIVQGAVLPRALIIAQGTELIRRMRAHMKCEDEIVLPLANTLLNAAAWRALEAQAPHAADPLFGQSDPLRFRALYDHLKDALEQ